MVIRSVLFRSKIFLVLKQQ